jgi:hypothetical protein
MPTKKLGKKNNKKAGIPAFFYKEKEVLVVSTFFIKKSGNTRFFIIFLPQLLGWH